MLLCLCPICLPCLLGDGEFSFTLLLTFKAQLSTCAPSPCSPVFSQMLLMLQSLFSHFSSVLNVSSPDYFSQSSKSYHVLSTEHSPSLLSNALISVLSSSANPFCEVGDSSHSLQCISSKCFKALMAQE